MPQFSVGAVPRAPRKHPVDLASAGAKLLGFRRHAVPSFIGGGLADFLRDLDRAEFRLAHGAEVRELGALGRERLVVEALCRLRVKQKVELVAPAELEAGTRQRIVPLARGGMPFGEVARSPRRAILASVIVVVSDSGCWSATQPYRRSRDGRSRGAPRYAKPGATLCAPRSLLHHQPGLDQLMNWTFNALAELIGNARTLACVPWWRI